MIKVWLVAGLVVLGGCSDDQEDTQEPVESDSKSSDNPDDLTMIQDGANTPTVSVPPSPKAPDLTAAPESLSLPTAATTPAPTTNTSPVLGEGESSAAGQNLFVRCMVLTIRSGPDVSNSVQGYLVFNAEIVPLAQQGKWVKVAEKKWVSRPYLTTSINPKPSLPAH